MPKHVLPACFIIAMVAACIPGSTPQTPNVSDKCPDVEKQDELVAFDWATNYALKQPAADRLKAAVLTAADVQRLEDKLDGELGIACAQIAHDLGNKGDWHSGGEACAAALTAVQEARAKLGPKAQLRLVVRPASCMSDVALATKCASLCDSTASATKIRAECDQRAGRCDGSCDGFCAPKNGAMCLGTCYGTCEEGTIKGACGGRCTGTCDGKRSSGPCLGTCVGTCDKAVDGECSGTCTGLCKLAQPGICSGTCIGACTVDFAEAKCASAIKVQEVTSECQARCNAVVINQTECATPQVGLVVTGVKDETFKTAIDKSLPGLLKIIHEVGDISRIDAALTMINGTNFSGPSEKQQSKCFAELLKKAAIDAATAKSAMERAVTIRDEIIKEK